MTLSRKISLWALPAFVLWMPGCGTTATSPTDATTTASPTPTPATSTVTAAVEPATVIVAASPDAGYVWSGSFVATISNTNASPITINAINADLQQSTGGIVITPITGTDEAFRFNVRAPGNRVDVNGTMAIPFTFFYTLPNGGREALVSLSFTVTTDSGASGAVTATASFQ